MSLEYEDKLAAIAEQLKKKAEPEPVTAREFISWFGAQRRGFWIVLEIRSALKKYKLVTQPDFESAYIDSPISFRPEPQEAPTEDKTQATSELFADPTYRIGKLEAANHAPVSVKPDALLVEAITLMLSKDYSQLPVMTTEREVKGMVSRESIGSRLALRKACKYVRDCMDAALVISADKSMFDTVGEIVAHQCVLIQNSEKVICGIVTTSDLSLQFRQLGEPFLLLGEIENHIRRMIQNKYTKEELTAACDPSDTQRKIEGVSDLTFGEYLRLLENPERWEKLGLHIDRALFVRQLDKIREIRNDVMHFDPDGIPDTDLEALRDFVGFMQRLSRKGAI